MRAKFGWWRVVVLGSLVAGWGLPARAASVAVPVDADSAVTVGRCGPAAPRPHKPQPPRPPLPPTVTAPAPMPGPGVVQVCAPVFGAGLPPASPVAASAASAPQPAIVPSAVAAVRKASDAEAAHHASDTIKFKIKDLIDAELTSESRALVWSMLTVFVVFSLLVVFTLKEAAKKPNLSRTLLAGAVIVAGIVAIVVARSFVGHGVDAADVDPLHAQLLQEIDLRIAAGLGNARDDGPARELAALRAEIAGRDAAAANARAAVSVASPVPAPVLAPTPVSTEPGLGAWVGAIAFGAVVAAGLAVAVLALRGWPSRPRPAGAPALASWPLPLDALFRVEDMLSEMRLYADPVERTVRSDDTPEIPDPNAFVAALDALRRQLEGGRGMDAELRTATPAGPIAWRLKPRTGVYTFYDLNTALTELDDALAARYAPDIDLPDWPRQAAQALAKTRRALVQACERAS
jgi:hypothetical protein